MFLSAVHAWETERAHARARGSAQRLEAAAARRTIRSTLDPLLEMLAREYTDDVDLSRRLRELFQAVHSLSESEMRINRCMTEMRRASTARRLCHRRRSANQTKNKGLGTSKFDDGLFGCGNELDERHVQRVEPVTAAG